MLEELNKKEIVEKYVLLAATANAPKETGAYNLFHVISVSMLVNRKTHCIEAATINVPSKLTQAYFEGLLYNFCILDDPEELFQNLRKDLLMPSTGAAIQALKMAFLRYKDKMMEK